MKQLIYLPMNPENQEHARICCNAELQLKHLEKGRGNLPYCSTFAILLLQLRVCNNIAAICLIAACVLVV